MNRFLLGALALACAAYAPFAVAADAASAKNFVDGLAKQVLAIVKSDLDKPTEAQKIEALFSDKVDINFIAKFALGKYSREATDAQRTAYIAAYKPFILKSYASRLTRYSGETYSLKQARPDGDATIVTMVITDPQGQTINVDYRLESIEGSYKIVDIIVEGVSLLNTQRSEFASIIDSKGLDGLIDALKAKVAAQP